MKIAFICSFLLLGCGSIQAQQIIDESGSELSADEKSSILKSISEALKDPQSANFTKMTRARKAGVCGYVNAKNTYGGYVGARMFYANLSLNQAFILPVGAEMRGYSIRQLEEVEKMVPIMQANCLTDAGNPIM